MHPEILRGNIHEYCFDYENLQKQEEWVFATARLLFNGKNEGDINTQQIHEELQKIRNKGVQLREQKAQNLWDKTAASLSRPGASFLRSEEFC